MTYRYCPVCGARVFGVQGHEIHLQSQVIRFGLAPGDRLSWVLVRCPNRRCETVARYTLDSPVQTQYTVPVTTTCSL